MTKHDVNSAEAKAERAKRRAMKAARGDFQMRAGTSAPVRFALVRDANGKPKFGRDPKSLTPAEQEACKSLMTKAEVKEYFG